jgi:hypothetical protein
MAQSRIQAHPPYPHGSMLQILTATKKVLQKSHMGIVTESSSLQPRLGRLLGHINAYDNAHHWCSENGDQIARTEQEARDARVRIEQKNDRFYQQNRYRSNLSLEFQTLAQYQAAIRSHFEAEKQTVVKTAEVISDCDFEVNPADEDSDETLSNESEEDSDCNDSEDPMIDFIIEGTRILLLHDATLDGRCDIATSEMLPTPRKQSAKT